MPLKSRLARAISRSSLAVLLFTAAAMTFLYYALAFQNEKGALEAKVELDSRMGSQVVSQSPELWTYSGIRFHELIEHHPRLDRPESVRITDLDGRVVAEGGEAVPPPELRLTGALLDSGRVVGRIEITRSLRPLLGQTLMLGLLASPAALGLWMLFRFTFIDTLDRGEAMRTELEQRFRLSFDFAPLGMTMDDLQGRMIQVNQAFCDLLGAPASRLLGTRTIDHVHPDDRGEEDARLEKMLKGGSSGFARDKRFLRQDGDAVWTHSSVSLVRDGDGEPRHLIRQVLDISETRRMQAELARMEKLESLSVLAGGIAHDFNNLLTAIIGNLALARMRLTDPAYAAARLDEADKASTRARDLTLQLLTFARGGEPIRKLADLGAVIREAAGFATPGGRVRIEFTLPRDLWNAEVDAGQVSQVVHNLVLNAEQAMPRGGTVRIRAENVVLGAGSPLPLEPGRYVRVDIQDEGVGIPLPVQSRIFDPFFTTRESGSGLGLASAYSIVRRHGGTIHMESEPGRGAAFTFYLPAGAGRQAAAPPHSTEAPRGKGRILLMDDEEQVRAVAREMLEILGYQVATSREGEEAIGLFLQAQAEGTPFDLVIFDLTIPGGMGGREAVENLRARHPGVRAIVSSGYSNDPVMSDPRAHGFSGVVSKPYRFEELAQSVAAALRIDA
jgi:two-component system cell cycle sensor histidine kinase/response regulator CckA